MSKTAHHILLAFTALLLAPMAATHAASELVLSREFRISELHEMPCAASHSGLRFEKRVYQKENALEWQVRLQSPAGEVSPLYEDVQSADFTMRFPSDQGVTLHWSKGSHSEATDFQPQMKACSAST